MRKLIKLETNTNLVYNGNITEFLDPDYLYLPIKKNYQVLIKPNEKVSFVLSDYLPLPYSVGSEKGWLDLIDFFPISRNRVVVICYSNFKKLRRDLIPVSIDSLHKPLRDNDGNYKIRVGTMYKKGVQTINEIFKSHCYEGFIY